MNMMILKMIRKTPLTSLPTTVFNINESIHHSLSILDQNYKFSVTFNNVKHDTHVCSTQIMNGYMDSCNGWCTISYLKNSYKLFWRLHHFTRRNIVWC